MEKAITVCYERMSNNEMVNIPVSYWLEKENERVTIFNYRIDLPDNEIPEWLTRKEFTVRQIFTPGDPGVTTTDFGGLILGNTLDMAGLTQTIQAHVEVKESIVVS